VWPDVKRADVDTRTVLRYADDWKRGQSRIGALDRLFVDGVPEKVAAAKIEQLVEQGLLQYGVSPAFPWPTPAGVEELHRPRRLI
jgi:hypothetical protein